MATRIALWVVGEPGAGKTTLVRRFIEPDSYLVEKPKWTVGERVVAAGHYVGGKFDGADTVPYNGVTDALAFYDRELRLKPLTIFDGDRFSYEACVSFLKVSGATPVCALLLLPEAEGQRRRDQRGSKQHPAWVKGRITKAHRFCKQFEHSIQLEATMTTEAMESMLRQLIARVGH